MKKFVSLIGSTLALLLVLTFLHETEAKFGLKKLVKAGIVLGALGSRKFPRILPVPVPIPIRLNQEHSFGGGHFGNEYYNQQGSGFVPAYGPGGYHLGSGGFGSGAYGGGGYSASGGWW